MKILICTGIFPPEIGGPATYAALLARELPRRGFNVEVLPFRSVRKLPRGARHLVYFLKVLARAPRSDVIFTQDPVSTGVPVVCAARLTGKKVVLRVAGDYAWEQAVQRAGVKDSIDEFQNKKYSFGIEIMRKLQAFSVRFADVVIAPSDYFNKLVSGWLRGKKRIVTVYNGIDLNEDFKREPKFNEKTIISAGRLMPWKGFDTLIRALEKLPEWRLFIAGDGPERERLEKIAREIGVSERVFFLGQLKRRELFSQIYRSHVFALLSSFESFSFQVVEAMHIGTPVIAADIGNLREIIDNEVSGILIPPKDIASFAQFCIKIIDEDNFKEKIVKNAKARAADFSIERTLENLSKIFK